MYLIASLTTLLLISSQHYLNQLFIDRETAKGLVTSSELEEVLGGG